MSMLRLCGRNGRIMRDQSHLHGNLPRWGICIRTNQKKATSIRQPFLIDPPQNPNCIIHMLQNMGQKNIVKFPCKIEGFKCSFYKSQFTAKPLLRCFNGNTGSLNTSYRPKEGKESLCKVSLEAAQL